MDLKQKLRRYDPDNKKRENKQKNNPLLSTQIPGKLIKKDTGTFFRRKKVYPYQHKHGLYQLTKIIPGDNNCKFYSNHRNLLFIDTETTGLMGGTGTLPFMIGIGYFTDKGFTVKQYFMRDYDEESPVLYTLKTLFKKYSTIVSFNGKSFDLPLLKTRFILNKFPGPEINSHIDLLHAARRLWSHLDSCSLNNLEKKVLNIKRLNDLPGSEVPTRYFSYLNEKKPGLVKPIFKHNLVDIISLVTLLIHIQEIHNNSPAIKMTANELFNIGKIREKEKEIKESIYFYRQARKKADSGHLKKEINIKLSWQYKRTGNWDKAVLIWKEMIEEKSGGLFPYRELAKYFEHQKKNHGQALLYTEQALTLLKDKRLLYPDFEKERDKLNHRRQRLQEKAST